MKVMTQERLHPHPDRSDVLVQPINGESPDLIKVCHRHEYAAPPVVYLADIGACPFCVAESEAIASRARYLELVGIIQGASPR